MQGEAPVGIICFALFSYRAATALSMAFELSLIYVIETSGTFGLLSTRTSEPTYASIM